MSPRPSSGDWFTSRRERRLWLLAAFVTFAIFSTLAVAPAVSRRLRERDLLEVSFTVGFVVLMVALAAMAFRVRPRGREIGLALGVAGVYVMVLARMGIPEERTHLIEYSLLAGLVLEALLERSGGRVALRPALQAFALTASVGVLDELIQWLLPVRVFDWRDVLFNVGAALMAVVAISALRHVRTSRSAPS